MSDFITRSYEPGDEEQIVELLNAVFPSGPWSDTGHSHLDYYKWKYLESPFNKVCIAVAESNGKIIGTAHSMLNKIHLNGKTWLSGIGADASVHPDYRQMGVFGAIKDEWMRQHSIKGVFFQSSISTNPILLERNIRRGYPRFPLDPVELVRYSKALAQLRATRKIGASYVAYKMSSILGGETKSDEININKISLFDEAFEKFSNRLQQSYDYLVVRDSDYLNWRYCDPRGGTYEVFSANDNGEVVGFLVLRNFQKERVYPKNGGYIVDLITLPERSDIYDALIFHALDYFDSVSVQSVRWWGLKNSMIYELLMKRGFLVSKNLNLFYTNPSDTKRYDLLKDIMVEKSHLAYGDHDHI